MKNMNALGLLLTGLMGAFLISTVQAQETFDHGPVSVFYVNGVANSLEDAQSSVFELKLAAKDYLHGLPPDMRFSLAYNPTDGLVKDVIESGIQSGIDTTKVLLMLGGAFEWDSHLWDVYLDHVAFSMAQPAVKDSVVNKHVAQYASRLLQGDLEFRGNKVILVSHSQGNFFVNDAIAKLSADQVSCVWNVGVATPDNRLEPKGKYTTLEHDAVIIAARALRSASGIDTRPTTTAHSDGNTPSKFNTFGHSFVKSYLYPGSRSRAEILFNLSEARFALRPENAPCARKQAGEPETPGAEWTFLLREASGQAYARMACQAGIDSCEPYFTGSEQDRTIEAAAASGLTAFAGPTFSEVTYNVTSGSAVSATVHTRHVVISRGTPGPGGELYYPYATAKSNVLARWTLNATGFDREGNPIPTFSYHFHGSGTSRLEWAPEPFEFPDDSDDPYPGIWLCPFPRLFFVNDETGASYITQVGDVGGDFNAGGSIRSGQYTVSLVAGGDQLTLTSGQMDSGQYPERSILCEQNADYELGISH